MIKSSRVTNKMERIATWGYPGILLTTGPDTRGKINEVSTGRGGAKVMLMGRGFPASDCRNHVVVSGESCNKRDSETTTDLPIVYRLASIVYNVISKNQFWAEHSIYNYVHSSLTHWAGFLSSYEGITQWNRDDRRVWTRSWWIYWDLRGGCTLVPNLCLPITVTKTRQQCFFTVIVVLISWNITISTFRNLNHSDLNSRHWQIRVLKTRC